MEDAILKALGIAGATAILVRAILSCWRKYRELYCQPREVIYYLDDWYKVEAQEEAERAKR